MHSISKPAISLSSYLRPDNDNQKLSVTQLGLTHEGTKDNNLLTAFFSYITRSFQQKKRYNQARTTLFQLLHQKYDCNQIGAQVVNTIENQFKKLLPSGHPLTGYDVKWIIKATESIVNTNTSNLSLNPNLSAKNFNDVFDENAANTLKEKSIDNTKVVEIFRQQISHTIFISQLSKIPLENLQEFIDQHIRHIRDILIHCLTEEKKTSDESQFPETLKNTKISDELQNPDTQKAISGALLLMRDESVPYQKRLDYAYRLITIPKSN